MASGKQSKRRRQGGVPKPPPPVGRNRQRRQASPRVLAAGAIVVVAAVVAIVLAVVLTGGSSDAKTPQRGSLGGAALPGAAEVQKLLNGIPQHDTVLGSPNAPATMVEYIDLQCPYCQQFETQAMPTLVEKYVRPGKLKVEARPLAFIGPASVRGRAAVIAAGNQGKFFNLAQILYLNQGTENTGWLDDDMVKAAAASVPGLDVTRLLDERGSSAVDAKASSFDQQAQTDKVNQTPTILVGAGSGPLKQVTLASPTDEKSVAAAIDAVLGG
jgi:protein-disulfide isomerase